MTSGAGEQSVASLGLPVNARELGARGSRTALADANPNGDLSPTAAAVLGALPSWWTARARAAGLAGDWLDVHLALEAIAPVALGQDPLLDETWQGLSGEAVGAAYAESLDSSTRARHGRHYTPSLLAGHLWGMCRKMLGHTKAPKALTSLTRDPACGAGALVLPILREHLAASRDVDPRMLLAGLPSRFDCIDTDPAAVWICNVVLAAEMLPVLAQVPERGRQRLPSLARIGDGLTGDLEPAGLVVMNPPYGRVKLEPAERERFRDVLYGHANLYGLFVAAGLESLAPGGVLGAVVPTSFTSGRYFSKLRSAISARAPLREVTFVANRSGVFGGVLQETCLGVFSESGAERMVVSALLAEDLHPVAAVRGSQGGGPWVLPRRADDAPVAAAALTMPLTLAEAGWQVSTGPLVWNRRSGDLHPRPSKNRAHVIWAADLDGGVLHRDTARNSLRYVTLKGPADRATLVLDQPAVLVQRTTAPEQRRRLVAAELTEQHLEDLGGVVVVENHVNVLRPSSSPALLSQACLARVLGTRTLDRLVRCVSGSVALSAYELASLRLPNREILASWEALEGEELENAVAGVYNPSKAK